MTDSELTPEEKEKARKRWAWESAVRRDYFRTRLLAGDPCPDCGEIVGHFAGSAERDPCKRIPADVPLEEVRPGCYSVRRLHICDAIRAACKG